MKITKTFALKKIANKIRMDIIQEIYYAKSGHPGGALSCADILIKRSRKCSTLCNTC